MQQDDVQFEFAVLESAGAPASVTISRPATADVETWFAADSELKDCLTRTTESTGRQELGITWTGTLTFVLKNYKQLSDFCKTVISWRESKTDDQLRNVRICLTCGATKFDLEVGRISLKSYKDLMRELQSRCQKLQALDTSQG